MGYDNGIRVPGIRKRGGTERGSVRFLIIIGLAALTVVCALGPRYGYVTNSGTLLAAGMVMWLATGMQTFFFDNWFARPTNGTSGKIGVAYVWIVLRIIAGAVFTALTVSQVLSYAMGLYVGIAVLAAIDALLFFVLGL